MNIIRSEHAANAALLARVAPATRIGAHALDTRPSVAPRGMLARWLARVRVARLAVQPARPVVRFNPWSLPPLE